MSSPDTPRVFKDPRTLWASNGSIPTPDGMQAMPPAAPLDEVSQSYVRLTSPLSSALSSPPGSQMSQSLLSKTPRDIQSSLNQDNLDSVADRDDAHTSHESAGFRKRAFRQRNPIQLHPYVVEQEKYRRILKARGLKPMRLAHSQDTLTRPDADGIPQQSESQEMYSEEVEMEESQSRESQWKSSPLSPLAKSRAGDAESNDGQSVPRDCDDDDDDDDDDDEFPDIDELMKGRVPISRPLNPRRRKESYSSIAQTTSAVDNAISSREEFA